MQKMNGKNRKIKLCFLGKTMSYSMNKGKRKEKHKLR